MLKYGTADAVTFKYGNVQVEKIYKGSEEVWSNYIYAFGSYGSWVDDDTCVVTNPFTCEESTYENYQKECQCLWGVWGSYMSVTSGSLVTPACGQGVAKYEVQSRTRSATPYSYNCNSYNCNSYSCNPYQCSPHDCNPYDCNCSTCYQTCYDTCYQDCNPHDCNPYDCNCTCSWTLIDTWFQATNASSGGGACTSKVVCTKVGAMYNCQSFSGSESCSTCYETCYDQCAYDCNPHNCNPYSCNCSTCYQTCYYTCYQTCWNTCWNTCWACSIGSYSSWASVSSCNSAYVSGGYCDGVQTTECQRRASYGYLQSKTRQCLRS